MAPVTDTRAETKLYSLLLKTLRVTLQHWKTLSNLLYSIYYMFHRFVCIPNVDHPTKNLTTLNSVDASVTE